MSTVPSEVNDPSPSRRNWLAALLLRSPGSWFGRFRLQLLHLSALGRNYRRRLSRKTALTVTGAALMLTLGGAALAGPLLGAPLFGADTITVSPGAAGIASGDGCSLVEAIINANNDAASHTECATGSGDDTIELQGNTYTYTDNFGKYAILPTITDTVIINGNGATIERDASADKLGILFVENDNLTLNETTITGGDAGSGGGIFVSYTGSLTLNYSTVTGNKAEIGGGIAAVGPLTLDNSQVDYNKSETGAGIYALNTTVTIDNGRMYGNEASKNTGALFVLGSEVDINGPIFYANKAAGDAGAIRVWDSDVSIINTLFLRNEAQLGGGVLINESTVTITNSRFFNNKAYQGGGVFANGSDLTITGGQINNNLATADGGGLRLYESKLNISNATVSGNEANHGAGIAVRGGDITSEVEILSSTLSTNMATYYGGAMDIVPFANVMVANSTISGNMADTGGGFNVAANSSLFIRQSTLTGNTAQGAGGIYLYGNSYLNLFGSIVSGNSAPLDAEIGYHTNKVAYIEKSVLGHGAISAAQAFSGMTIPNGNILATSDGGNIALGAILNTILDHNGGPPMLTHALVPNSPALDFVSSAACANAPIDGVDQRGEPRNLDGDSQPGDEECDAGAFELAVEEPTATPSSTPNATTSPTSTATPSPTATATATPTGTVQPPGDERNYLPFTTR